MPVDFHGGTMHEGRVRILHSIFSNDPRIWTDGTTILS
jgi:hypothetical protein